MHLGSFFSETWYKQSKDKNTVIKKKTKQQKQTNMVIKELDTTQ